MTGTAPRPPPLSLPKKPRGLRGWASRAASAALVLGSSHSDLRVLSPGFRIRAFPTRRQPPGVLTRPRPHGQQKVRSDACGHNPLSEGLLQVKRGGFWGTQIRVRVSSMRVQVSRPFGPRTTLPRGLGSRCVPTADARAIRASRTLRATSLREELQRERTGSALPTPRQ